MHFWAGKGYPVGWLFTPEKGSVREPASWIPYACDNGRFAVWDKNATWHESHFLNMLDAYCAHPIKPRWVVVPDAVGNRDETLRQWEIWAPQITKGYDLPLAFAAQDGMSPKDVPSSAEMVFMGGTFEWKWRNLPEWAECFPRLHVGRVNTLRHLLRCKQLGVESVDGTGWFRSPHRVDALHRYFRIQAGEESLPEQLEFNYGT